jgi:hypothetical protein
MTKANAFVLAAVLVLIAAATASTGSGAPDSAQRPGDFPQFVWHQSLPLRFGDPAVTPIGGTEMRALAIFDHKLFAGVGYWMDTEKDNPALPGAQVLRLDAAEAQWQVDVEFAERDPWRVKLRKYMAVSTLVPVSFTIDDEGRALDPPAELLLAGTFSRNVGLDVFSRTTGSPHWSYTPIASEKIFFESHIRAFAVHRDRKTGAEMVFAGAPNTIFAGHYNRQKQSIVWNPEPDWVGEVRGSARSRVMSLTECNDKIYATQNNAIFERTDGDAPTWLTEEASFFIHYAAAAFLRAFWFSAGTSRMSSGCSVTLTTFSLAPGHAMTVKLFSSFHRSHITASRFT